MRTEMTRVYTAAQHESLTEAGYDQYTFIAEPTACDVCKQLDGKHFPVEDLEDIGNHAPPIHPNCRCSVAAYMDREEFEWKLYEDEAVQEISYERPLDDFRKKTNIVNNTNDIVLVNKGNEKGRRQNCQRCVPAYELRRRGYDVVARPAAIDKDGRVIIDDAMKNQMSIFKGMKKRIRSAGSFDG